MSIHKSIREKFDVHTKHTRWIIQSTGQIVDLTVDDLEAARRLSQTNPELLKPKKVKKAPATSSNSNNSKSKSDNEKS